MTEEKKPLNFIEQIIEEDIKSGKHEGRVHTRFPPEPNGYLHIGHAKSICLNFGLAERYHGKTNLRFDDTNPTNESVEYVNAIKRDIKWLGFDWEDREYYSSDYFPKLYDFAVQLIKKGKAYVDDSSPEEIAEMKGDTTQAGVESPFRNRSVEENLELFQKMRAGEFEEGSRVLRAKIDMSSPNMHMRDPILYRIKKVTHHRTGDEWPIYPMYDFAHGQSDSIEHITHSLCSIEFENHRPLYNWFIEELEIFPSRQIEFARLNLSFTVLSKRRLLKLVQEGVVDGWDDPRMPTISGMRRRGYPAAAIRDFSDRIGIAKRDNVIDMSLLEFSVREQLNKSADRAMAVLDPVKLTITNWPEGKVEKLEIENNPEMPERGMRELSFSGKIFIESFDFNEEPPKKFFRLGPGRMVRLKGAYIIECHDFIKNEDGSIKEILCTYHRDSKSGQDTSGLKVKGTIHWVDQLDHREATVLLYDRLFVDPTPSAHKDKDFMEFLNPDSVQKIEGAKIEPILASAQEGETFQFLRKGYFCVDKTSSADRIVFNRTVALRDTWKKLMKQQKGK